MKKLIILCLFISGCAYNQITVEANNGSYVYCNGSVDKPVTVSTPITAKDNTVPMMP